MRHRLTRAAERQARNLEMPEDEVLYAAKHSAPYTDPLGYFNRRYEGYLLRVGDERIHAVSQVRELTADQEVIELIIMARDALRDTITEDLDEAIKENAQWVLSKLEEVTPQ